MYIDGILTGFNLKETDDIDAGIHKVEVRQQRLTRESVLFLDDIDVLSGQTVTVTFQIPEALRSETRAITVMKRDIERALSNNSSLFDLRTAVNEMVINMPDWMEEKPVLEDYALKVQIEIELRKAVTDYIYGDPVKTSWFEGDFTFLDYPSDTTKASEDFTQALKYVLVLKRLEILRTLVDKDLEAFELQLAGSESDTALAEKVSPQFVSQYKNDLALLEGLYAYYIPVKKIRDKGSFFRQIERYYGTIWSTLEQVKKGDFSLDMREVQALKAAWLALEPPEDFVSADLPSVEKKLKWTVSAGGGSLLTAGIHWEPVRWFAFQAGLSGAYDFFNRSAYPELGDGDASLTFTLPIEFDFFIFNRKFELFIGLAADMLRLQNRSTPTWNSGDNTEGSDFAQWTSFGFNLGFGWDLGPIDLYLNNYLYFPELISDDFHIYSLRYSPGIGVRF